MRKPAEDTRAGEVLNVNGNPYSITKVTTSFDAVWIDIDVGGLELPVRCDYGDQVEILAAEAAA